MPKPFSTVPNRAGPVKAFEMKVPEEEVARFKALLALSPIGPETWENRQEDGQFGVSRAWLIKAQDVWLHSFNWRLQEARINAVPNFYATVKDDKCGSFKVHFAALFSRRDDAVPIVLLHGWPGSFLEFLPIMTLLKNKYTPETLPYHVVVPSLPGFALSTGPPVDQPFTNEDCSRVIDGLMQLLGFGQGYVAHGGDYGGVLCNALASDKYPSCKAQHVNIFFGTPAPDQVEKYSKDLTEKDKESLARVQNFRVTGMAYGIIHATRSATIGLALSTSPLALLAWIGEKFIEWSDVTPSLDEILASVSLYWLTATFPRSIYLYRDILKWTQDSNGIVVPGVPSNTPYGYSAFYKEIAFMPKCWKEMYPSMVYYGPYEEGGHFAAMEKPEVLLRDVEDFVHNHVQI